MPLNKETIKQLHPNIGKLKTFIKEEWNKMYEQLILKACKSFPRPYWVNLKFCINLLFAVYFLKYKLILFYKIALLLY